LASKTYVIVGIVFVLLGLAALIHPRLEMPAQRSEVQIGSQKIKLETRRIVTIPPAIGGLLALAGAGVIFLGARKP
jgi:hypothetical protein